MKYSFEETEEAVIIHLKDDLIGHYQLDSIVEELTDWIAAKKAFFIIDLANLRAINSSGLAILLTILTKSRNAGGDAVLANIPEHLADLLIMTKLHSIFTVLENVEDGCAILV